jgi:hypothetical protein
MVMRTYYYVNRREYNRQPAWRHFIHKKETEEHDEIRRRTPKETGVQADKGYTHLKLNDQNVEEDVTITQEVLNTWKTKILHGKLPDCLQKNDVDRECSL